jgi:hypothetical protein
MPDALDVLHALNGPSGQLLPMAVVLLWTISSAAKRGFSSVKRLGERIGRVEQAQVADRKELKLERTRRRQLESVLRDCDVYVPAWPDDDDDELPLPQPRRRPVSGSPTADEAEPSAEPGTTALPAEYYSALRANADRRESTERG